MINRRSFLITTTALTLSSLLSACEENYDLEILFLKDSLPRQLINVFKQELKQSRKLNFTPKPNLQDLYQLLLSWQGKNIPENKQKSNFSLSSLFSFFSFGKSEILTPTDLVTLGNYWLTEAIQEKLITPLDRKNLTNWHNLPSAFKNLVTRNNQGNIDNQGKIWAAPYRWGYTMIAYRQDKFEKLGWQPQDWSDLWRSEIKHKFSLLNQPREVIGLTLKKLGYSYNWENIETIPQLKSELQTLNQQVKFYDSQNYLQPLILGDTWLTVGWSSDIIPLLKSYKNIAGVIPLSGTSLWADLWVKPKKKDLNPERLTRIDKWINFCWQPESAQKINLFTNGVSPISPKAQSQENIPIISPEIIAKSEFILPVSASSLQEYDSLWHQM